MAPSATDPPLLIIVGASVRSLAESAHRSGWAVHAADRFADADLRAVAAAVRVPTGPDMPWPDGLDACFRWFPRAAWTYTGALENHPDLVDRLARERPLAGNPGVSLRAARDPTRLGQVVRKAGLFFPDTFPDSTRVPPDGSFLVKPLGSAGGRGIARWRGGPAGRGGRVWQRFVPGRSWSAGFAIDAGGARPFGFSRQLVGRRWCGARGFAYCGSIDVRLATLPASLLERLARLGGVLADDLGLRGLVGVDLVLDSSGGLHVIEVNPRPTASLELVERATGASVAATHLAAWGVSAPFRTPPRPAACWAKAVVFADRGLEVDGPIGAALDDLAAGWSDGDWPALADLPAVGTALHAGGPALTVFAAGGSAAEALATLRSRVAAVRALLGRAALSRPDAVAGRPSPPPAGSIA